MALKHFKMSIVAFENKLVYHYEPSKLEKRNYIERGFDKNSEPYYSNLVLYYVGEKHVATYHRDKGEGWIFGIEE